MRFESAQDTFHRKLARSSSSKTSLHAAVLEQLPPIALLNSSACTALVGHLEGLLGKSMDSLKWAATGQSSDCQQPVARIVCWFEFRLHAAMQCHDCALAQLSTGNVVRF